MCKMMMEIQRSTSSAFLGPRRISHVPVKAGTAIERRGLGASPPAGDERLELFMKGDEMFASSLSPGGADDRAGRF